MTYMKFIKPIILILFIVLFNNCKQEKKEEHREKKEVILNVFNEKDVDKVKDFLSELGSNQGNGSIANTIDSKPWFWEIHFNTKDTITKISSIYTRNLTSPYLSSHPTQIYGQTLKLETYDFGIKDSTKVKNYRNSLFSLDSINLKILPKLVEKAMKLHKRKYYKQRNDTIVGIKIYKPNFSLISKINIMVQIGNPNNNYLRHATNNMSDKLYYSTYEFNHKGKFLFSEHKGMQRQNYTE